MTPLESKLRSLVAALDAPALEALASKGLLRRAQKDLERGIELRLEGEVEGLLRFKIGEHVVSLPATGPATATCSCPSAGICQHILTAVLWLQRPATGENTTSVTVPASDSSDATERELMSLTPVQLEQWAGKAAFRAGLKMAGQSPLEISRTRGLHVRFPAMNAECHFVPGGGLDGVIASGGKGDGRSLTVAAVIGFQKSRGVNWETPTGMDALEASDGAPRSRAEVLQTCQSLLEDTASKGLARLSSADQQRWATLAVSALGVNLPRLALALRGLSDEALLNMSRDARSDLGRMLERMAQTHALCAALQTGGENPRADLVGWHRTRYDEVGHLELTGVAAWPWRTASGYEGLTILFWDPAAKRWNSWSESRPRHQLAGFKPVFRYSQPGPWEGAESPRQLSHSSFRLMNARRNAAYRLSSTSKSRVLVTGPAANAVAGLSHFSEWAALAEHLGTHSTIGLKDADPLAPIVAVKPDTWGDRAFDAVDQALRWDLFDVHQCPLLLELPFDDLNEPAIRFLEAMPCESLKDAVLIGRAMPTDHGLHLHPFSLHRPGQAIIHLALDPLAHHQAQPAAPSSAVEEAELNPLEEDESPVDLNSPLPRMLSELDDALLALAEAGTASSRHQDWERLRQAAARADRLSLEALATVLNRFAAQPKSGALLLRCAYVTQMHWKAISTV